MQEVWVNLALKIKYYIDFVLLLLVNKLQIIYTQILNTFSLSRIMFKFNFFVHQSCNALLKEKSIWFNFQLKETICQMPQGSTCNICIYWYDKITIKTKSFKRFTRTWVLHKKEWLKWSLHKLTVNIAIDWPIRCVSVFAKGVLPKGMFSRS